MKAPVETAVVHLSEMRLLALTAAATSLVMAKRLDVNVEAATMAFTLTFERLFQPIECECERDSRTETAQ